MQRDPGSVTSFWLGHHRRKWFLSVGPAGVAAVARLSLLAREKAYNAPLPRQPQSSRDPP